MGIPVDELPNINSDEQLLDDSAAKRLIDFPQAPYGDPGIHDLDDETLAEMAAEGVASLQDDDAGDPSESGSCADDDACDYPEDTDPVPDDI